MVVDKSRSGTNLLVVYYVDRCVTIYLNLMFQIVFTYAGLFISDLDFEPSFLKQLKIIFLNLFYSKNQIKNIISTTFLTYLKI